MRIIGYIDHPVFKITVFKTDTRLSAKFEVGHLEQTYKFRIDDRLKTLEDVQQIVDLPFIDGVAQRFQQMNILHGDALKRYLLATEDEEFDEIF